MGGVLFGLKFFGWAHFSGLQVDGRDVFAFCWLGLSANIFFASSYQSLPFLDVVVVQVRLFVGFYLQPFFNSTLCLVGCSVKMRTVMTLWMMSWHCPIRS